MVEFKPCGESSLAHSSLFQKSLTQSPNQRERLMLGSGMESPPCCYILFCPFETGKHFLGDVSCTVYQKTGEKQTSKPTLLTYSKANVIRGKGVVTAFLCKRRYRPLGRTRHHFCSRTSADLGESLICRTTRYCTAVSAGTGAASGFRVV